VRLAGDETVIHDAFVLAVHEHLSVVDTRIVVVPPLAPIVRSPGLTSKVHLACGVGAGGAGGAGGGEGGRAGGGGGASCTTRIRSSLTTMLPSLLEDAVLGAARNVT
jgi:hypothetical protein